MRRRDALAAMVAVPLGGYASQSAAWREAAPVPFSTQEIYPAVHQGRLYVAGGIAARLGVPYFTDRSVSYDPSRDSWRDEPGLPEPLHHVALASAGDELYAMGGFNGGYSHIWRMRSAVYQLAAGNWREVAAFPKPLAEGVGTLAPTGLIHYVTGQSPRGAANAKRSDHGEVHDHLCFDPSDGRWRPLAPIPTARNSASGGWLGGQLVVAGGRTATGNLAVTEIYDPDKDTWHQGRPMPLPQAGTAAAVVNHGLYVFGGEIFQPSASVFAEVWRYVLENDQWQAMPPLPTPRHGLGAGAISGNIHVVGGATRPGGRGTSDIHEVLDSGA